MRRPGTGTDVAAGREPSLPLVSSLREVRDARDAGVDALRGVAIAAVVALHVSWRMLTPDALSSAGGMVVATVHVAAGFGVPLFLALSAWGMTLRHAEPFGGARAWLDSLAARAARLLPAYVLWSLASLAARDPSLLTSPHEVVVALLTGSADIQFYFVPMLFEFYLFWPLVRPLLVRCRGVAAVGIVGIAVALSVAAWQGLWSTPLTSLALFAVWPVLGAALAQARLGASPNDSSVASLNTATDARTVRRSVGLVASILAIVALGAVVAALPFGDDTLTPGGLLLVLMIFQPLPALYAVSLVVALAAFASRLASGYLGRFLVALGRQSYGVFLLHLLVASSAVYRWFDFPALLTAGPFVAASTFLVVWTATLALSWALARALSISPRTAWSVGH